MIELFEVSITITVESAQQSLWSAKVKRPLETTQPLLLLFEAVSGRIILYCAICTRDTLAVRNTREVDGAPRIEHLCTTRISSSFLNKQNEASSVQPLETVRYDDDLTGWLLWDDSLNQDAGV